MIDLRRIRREPTVLEEQRRASLSIAPEPERREEDGDEQVSSSPCRRLVVWYDYLTMQMWRICELHMSKIVNFTMICVVLSQASILRRYDARYEGMGIGINMDMDMDIDIYLKYMYIYFLFFLKMHVLYI